MWLIIMSNITAYFFIASNVDKSHPSIPQNCAWAAIKTNMINWLFVSLYVFTCKEWFMVYGVCHYQQYFSNIVAVSFIGGGILVPRENLRPVASH